MGGRQRFARELGTWSTSKLRGWFAAAAACWHGNAGSAAGHTNCTRRGTAQGVRAAVVPTHL